MNTRRLLRHLLVFLTSGLVSAFASPQDKIDAQIALIKTWAADPVIVDAVRAHNAQLSPEELALDQEKWGARPQLDSLIRGYAKNAVGTFLSTKRNGVIAEAFVSDAAGYKVGFINKPTFWCHAGKPKHDVPMSGKTWQGRIEIDTSTGMRQLQISVPVLDAGKPIGSLVVGLSTAVLSE